MHTVVRTYTGKAAGDIIDFIAANKASIDALMNSVAGFRSYSLVRTAEGGFSVTVADTESASNEITAKARDWVAKNAAHIGAIAPSVKGGTVIMHII